MPIPSYKRECPFCKGAIPLDSTVCDHCNRAVPLPTCNNVILTRIDIPFWELVRFMIIAGLAALPAGVILYLISMVLNATLLAPFLAVAR